MLTCFSPKISLALNAYLEQAPPSLACFDADGTLWAHDAGEAFLQWLIQDGVVLDVWGEYARMAAVDPEAAYAFCTRVMAGLKEEEVVARAEAFFSEYEKNTFPAMRELLQRLSERGHTIWIVSGSNRWLIEAAARKLGLDPRQTIAQAVEVQNGVLTDKDVEPTIFGAGKVKAILSRLKEPPALAAGNSWSDVEMLKLATRLRLLVNPTRLVEGEQDLIEYALSCGWLVEPLRPE